VKGLAHAESVEEVHVCDLRDRVLDALKIVSTRLGRRTVAASIRVWCTEAELEISFPWNTGFVSIVLRRKKEVRRVTSTTTHPT
jgi:hypothetical protein